MPGKDPGYLSGIFSFFHYIIKKKLTENKNDLISETIKGKF